MVVFIFFQVKFHNEEAEDVGGVKKEFFMLLLREILDPKYGMFKEYEETRTIWFSSDSLEDEVMYFLIGLLCGLAIYNFIIIDLPFPLALYKKLLGESVGLNDIKDMSPVIAKYVIHCFTLFVPELLILDKLKKLTSVQIIIAEVCRVFLITTNQTLRKYFV